MRWRRLSGNGEGTYAVIFETGDELDGGLQRFARQNFISTARFYGIGGLADVVLGFYDPVERRYRKIPIAEQVELVSLIGDITISGPEPEGETVVHAHAMVALSDGSARGGHLMEAHVRPTVECIVTESPSRLRRRLDAASGLALIDLGGPEGGRG